MDEELRKEVVENWLCTNPTCSGEVEEYNYVLVSPGASDEELQHAIDELGKAVSSHGRTCSWCAAEMNVWLWIKERREISFQTE